MISDVERTKFSGKDPRVMTRLFMTSSPVCSKLNALDRTSKTPEMPFL